MMFPHSMTIYRLEADETISRQIVRNVYWQAGSAIAPGSKGDSDSSSVRVICSPETSRACGTTWTVRPHDRIVKGEGEAITSFKALENSFTVLSVDDNVIGCPVDNITIAGK